MAKALAVLLVLLALAAEVLFFMTGGGTPLAEPEQLSQSLPAQLVGTPWLAVAGGVVFVLGVLLAGRQKDEPYAIREVVLAISVAVALALATGVVVGVIRRWTYPTLGALAAGGCAETLVAIGICARVAMADTKSKLLFVPGLIVTILLAVFFLVLIVLGTG